MPRSRSTFRGFVGGVVAAGLVLTSVSAIASAASDELIPRGPYDGRSPLLRMRPITFVVGSVIDAAVPYDPDECDMEAWHFAVPMKLAWVGKDRHEVLESYDLWAIPPNEPSFIVLDDSPLTELEVLGGNYDSSCGDASTSTTYRVETADQVGNAAQVVGDSGVYMGVWQEDGSSVPWQDGTVTMSGTGAWSAVSCECSDAGATFTSSTAGDDATYEVVPHHKGQSFALVMPTGPDRGEVSISVDGAEPVVVDTYSKTARDRVVVWQTKMLLDAHTVTITNLATSGRPRIDIDAVMLS